MGDKALSWGTSPVMPGFIVLAIFISIPERLTASALKIIIDFAAIYIHYNMKRRALIPISLLYDTFSLTTA
jgi:hypothetical protein